MKGQDIVKAWRAWLDTVEGRRCMDGNATGGYLRNRLERAFMAGIDAAEDAIKQSSGRDG